MRVESEREGEGEGGGIIGGRIQSSILGM